ncbi:glutathione S-transferase A-like [Haliotis rufescens]|uniref:glutathione S-transferase A-like n=1 Tax=Haliotis rufescens TaxID=6454 RepID=UPI00201F652A|nr:glutathione S-transferase A-like [Haliotis rufescens]
MLGYVCRQIGLRVTSQQLKRVCSRKCSSVTGASSDMHLHWASGSAPCWKVMLVLEEKGVRDYPNKRLRFTLEDLKSDEVVKLNPRGQVPIFQDGSTVLKESGAVCLYLEHKFQKQGTTLLPDDYSLRGAVLQRMFETDNIGLIIMKKVAHVRFLFPKDKIDEDKMIPKYKAARRELLLWEGYLSDKSDFLVGNNFTMADVFLFPYVAFFVRYGLDIEKYPAMQAYYNKVKDRPSVKTTWPPHWTNGQGDSSVLGSI